MSANLAPERIGDDLIELAVETPSAARALAASLQGHPLALEIVPALDRVAVRFDLENAAAVTDWLQSLEQPSVVDSHTSEPQLIDIKYGGDAGPDFESVCEVLALSGADFIDLHTSLDHCVEMIGFTPGFAYLSGLPGGFKVPRLAQPRARVPAGSVGLSAAFTGIYALAGPGGWPLIGRTSAELFQAQRDPAFLLSPGQTVRFRAV